MVLLRDLAKNNFFKVNYLPGIKLKSVPEFSAYYHVVEYQDGTLRPYYNMDAPYGHYIWLNDNQEVTPVGGII